MGKLIGTLIGFFTLNIPGAIIGFIAGHFFDKGRGQLNSRFSPEEKEKIEAAFFHVLFPVLGYLAKADGRVSEEEIQSTEELIRRMGLNEAQRKEAIQLFQQGKSDSFNLDTCFDEFNSVSHGYSDVKRILLVYLITLALADGVLHETEERVLAEVAEKIAFSRFAFNQLLGMVRAQMAFRDKYSNQSSGYEYYRESHQGGQSGNPFYNEKKELDLAYEALGMTPHDSDAVIKKAYRKLMSENHPDKLAGRGVPEEMVKLATERSQEIQKAYEVIKKSRKN